MRSGSPTWTSSRVTSSSRSETAKRWRKSRTSGWPSPPALRDPSRPAVVDPRADIYSFGWLAYELLSGETPFPVTTDADLDRRLAEAPAVMPMAIPGHLRALVRQMLNRDPGARPKSMAEVCADWNPEARYPDGEEILLRLARPPYVERSLARDACCAHLVELGRAASADGRPRVVLVDGPGGIGRMRFLAEIRAWLAIHHGEEAARMAVAERLDGLPATAAGAVHLVGAAPSEQVTERHALAPLDVAAIRELLERLFRVLAHADEAATAIWEATGGLPKLVVALIRGLVESGAAIAHATLSWVIATRRIEEIAAGKAFAGMRAEVARVMAGLADEPRRVLGALAVAGVWLRAEEIAEVLGWEQAAVDQALTGLDSGEQGTLLILRDGERIRKASVCVQAPVPADLQVERLARIVREQDRLRAFRLLRAAGDAAETARYGIALVEELVLEDAHRDVIEILEVLQELGGASVCGARVWVRLRAFEVAARRGLPDVEIDVARLRVVADEAVALAAEMGDPLLQARALAAWGATRLFPIEERCAAAEQALALAEATGDRGDAYALACHAVATLGLGGNALPRGEALLDRLQEVRWEGLEESTRCNLLAVLINSTPGSAVDRIRQVDGYVEDSLRRCEDRPRAALRLYAITTRVQQKRLEGDFAGALAAGEDALASWPNREHRFYLPLATRVLVSAGELGLMRRAYRHAARAREHAMDLSQYVSLTNQQAELARLAGMMGTAYSTIKQAEQLIAQVSAVVSSTIALTRCDLYIDLGPGLEVASLPELDGDDLLDQIFLACTRARDYLARRELDGARAVLDHAMSLATNPNSEEALTTSMLLLRCAVMQEDKRLARYIMAQMNTHITTRRKVEAVALIAAIDDDESALLECLKRLVDMDLTPIELDTICLLIGRYNHKHLEKRFWKLVGECAIGLPLELAESWEKKWRRELEWHARR